MTSINRPDSPRRLWLVRSLVAVLALAAWFWTQSLLATRTPSSAGIGDGLHALTAPLHQSLLDHPRAANGLLVVTSAFIDAFGIFLLGSAIFGPSIRPFLGLLVLFALRQLCQMLCALPPPDGMIWRNPGFPSLLVTYGTSTDFFFSGHTAIAVYGATELARFGRRWLTALGFVVAGIEAATVIVLRAHYTMDVFAGAMAALLVAMIVPKLSEPCDRAMARIRKT